jgi:hypothetical protein
VRRIPSKSVESFEKEIQEDENTSIKREPSNALLLSILTLIEHGAQIPDEQNIPSGLLFAMKNRIIEITFIQDYIFQKFNTSIALIITDFTMLPIKNISLQNLMNFLD